MILKNDSEVEKKNVEQDGVANVSMKILIGPEDGSENIVMRQFLIQPGGHTPFHQHSFEHIVKIMAGKGRIIKNNENSEELVPGQSLFVSSGEVHQFRNPYKQPFEFLCIILGPQRTGNV